MLNLRLRDFLLYNYLKYFYVTKNQVSLLVAQWQCTRQAREMDVGLSHHCVKACFNLSILSPSFAPPKIFIFIENFICKIARLFYSRKIPAKCLIAGVLLNPWFRESISLTLDFVLYQIVLSTSIPLHQPKFPYPVNRFGQREAKSRREAIWRIDVRTFSWAVCINFPQLVYLQLVRRARDTSCVLPSLRLIRDWIVSTTSSWWNYLQINCTNNG